MSRKWTQRAINKLTQRGMTVSISPIPENRVIIPRQEAPQIGWMHWNLLYFCNEHALQLEKEYRFDQKRYWRFDFAIPALKIGIEYEGIYSDISGHTSHRGFNEDVEKYNAAAKYGWTLLRYTANNYKNILQDLKKIIL